MLIGDILEAIMMICFGASWPISIMKTIKVKNPKGKSVLFLYLLEIGYLAGIAGKIVTNRVDGVILLYILNTLMVATDLVLTIYYKKQVEKREAEMELQTKFNA